MPVDERLNVGLCSAYIESILTRQPDLMGDKFTVADRTVLEWESHDQ